MPLYIDGTKMPNPSFNAISCSDEKVWSSNTGRSKSAYMNGRRILPGIRCFRSTATLVRPVGQPIPVPGIAGISSTTK